jgi:hypothetical protein
MNLRDRIGYDAGGTRLEDALTWAAANALHYVDFNADRGSNRLDTWSDERLHAVRDTCARHDIHLGCIPLPAVMWRALYVSDAVVRICRRTSMSPCGWGASGLSYRGYCFSSDIEPGRSPPWSA